MIFSELYGVTKNEKGEYGFYNFIGVQVFFLYSLF